MREQTGGAAADEPARGVCAICGQPRGAADIVWRARYKSRMIASWLAGTRFPMPKTPAHGVYLRSFVNGWVVYETSRDEFFCDVPVCAACADLIPRVTAEQRDAGGCRKNSDVVAPPGFYWRHWRRMLLGWSWLLLPGPLMLLVRPNPRIGWLALLVLEALIFGTVAFALGEIRLVSREASAWWQGFGADEPLARRVLQLHLSLSGGALLRESFARAVERIGQDAAFAEEYWGHSADQGKPVVAFEVGARTEMSDAGFEVEVSVPPHAPEGQADAAE